MTTTSQWVQFRRPFTATRAVAAEAGCRGGFQGHGIGAAGCGSSRECAGESVVTAEDDGGAMGSLGEVLAESIRVNIGSIDSVLTQMWSF